MCASTGLSIHMCIYICLASKKLSSLQNNHRGNGFWFFPSALCAPHTQFLLAKHLLPTRPNWIDMRSWGLWESWGFKHQLAWIIMRLTT